MPWNPIAPDGSQSVKANRSILGDNTTYTETTMGNSAVGTNSVSVRDHFWDVGSDEDGRHRFIQSLGFTDGGSPADPVLGTGMDSVVYAKEVNTDVARIEWFHRNVQGIYQFIPSFLSGSVSITSSSSYVTVVAVPINVYGEIFMYRDGAQNKYETGVGFFRSNATDVQAWTNTTLTQGDASTNPTAALKFANGSDASGLNIRARRQDGGSGTWHYRITFRAL